MRVNTTIPALSEQWERALKWFDETVETTNGIRGWVVSAWPGSDRRIGLLIQDERYPELTHYTSNEYATIVRGENV